MLEETVEAEPSQDDLRLFQLFGGDDAKGECGQSLQGWNHSCVRQGHARVAATIGFAIDGEESTAHRRGYSPAKFIQHTGERLTDVLSDRGGTW